MRITDIKSLAYAFISNDINVYFPDNGQECFVIERLCCEKCSTHWHTSLLECYFCGELNYYLYQCTTCNKKYSITNSSIRCNCGNINSKLIKACINPKCPSNTVDKIKKIALKEKGVFNLKSSLNLSLMYCINCGSPSNYYKSFKVFIYNDRYESNFNDYFKRIEKDFVLNDIIILKKHNSVLKYDFFHYSVQKQEFSLPSTYRFKNIGSLIFEIIRL